MSLRFSLEEDGEISWHDYPPLEVCPGAIASALCWSVDRTRVSWACGQSSQSSLSQLGLVTSSLSQRWETLGCDLPDVGVQ